PQLSSDLGVGLLTLNKGVQQHQHDDLMSGPHEDVEKETSRRGVCKSERQGRSPERPLSSSCPIQFAGAANVRFPPFM
ncbi:MAG: transposase, partial [Yoonia sp.]